MQPFARRIAVAPPVPWVLLAVTVAMLALKLVIAAETDGTNDILHWIAFVNTVNKYGPVRVYSAHINGSYYNHPPLMGYVILGMDWLRHLGIPVRFSIRAMSSAADVVSVFVVYSLVRRRRGDRVGLLAGVLVACSPVLFAISGFHGNTDPIFTMLVLLAAYLLIDRDLPVLAGAALSLAVGVKIVAVVAVPCLLVYAALRGRRVLAGFVVTAGAVFLLTWGPALALDFAQVKAHVIDYPGLGLGQWGLMQFGHWAGNPSWVPWMKGSGRDLFVALAAGAPAVLVWRRPSSAVVATATSLAGFLALSPAFAVQYLAWGAIATIVISPVGGAVYNLTAGLFLFRVYDRWGNRFFPLSRRVAFYHPLTEQEVVFAVLIWAVLLLVCWQGLRSAWASPRQPARSPARTPPCPEAAPTDRADEAPAGAGRRPAQIA